MGETITVRPFGTGSQFADLTPEQRKAAVQQAEAVSTFQTATEAVVFVNEAKVIIPLYEAALQAAEADRAALLEFLLALSDQFRFDSGFPHPAIHKWQELALTDKFMKRLKLAEVTASVSDATLKVTRESLQAAEKRIAELEAALRDVLYKHPNGHWYQPAIPNSAAIDRAGALLDLTAPAESIDELRGRIEGLEAALEPFAKWADKLEVSAPGTDLRIFLAMTMKPELPIHLRRAKAALEAGK